MELDKILTPEEQAFLEKIQSKYMQHMTSLYEANLEKFTQDPQAETAEPLNVAEPSRHITNYQREIVVRTIAEISTINEQGKLTNIESCFEDAYHIPVPPDTDYEPLLKEFVEIFDRDITHCATKMTKAKNA